MRRFVCSADGMGERYTYTSSDCAEDMKIATPVSFDYCYGFWQTLIFFDIYRTIDVCVADGEIIALNDLCDGDNNTYCDATPLPTMNVTEDSGDDAAIARLSAVIVLFVCAFVLC